MSLSFAAACDRDIYELSELARMFGEAPSFYLDEKACRDKNAQKRKLYSILSEACEKTLDWGILTGVRPSKLYRELAEKLGEERGEEALRKEYFVSDQKLELLRDVYRLQSELLSCSDPRAVSIYVGIPFCPTRCLYCSFTSNRFSKEASVEYLKALKKEIFAVKNLLSSKGLYAESVYIGGGTPTSLEDEELLELLSSVSEAFVSSATREWTLEAGRPDTITASKLAMMKDCGVDRISINPQSMKRRSLELIGRAHGPEQIIEAFELARKAGIKGINADLIAGLPEELPEDFQSSLEQITALEPSNITVHTLAVKRASRLIDEDPGLALRQSENVAEMLASGRAMLRDAGYEPYYMYRQKQAAGNFENAGYCTKGCVSVYNIRIMDERQSNIALGAGGISKICFPDENRIERIPNVSNYEIYIARIDEMIARKEKGIL